MVWTQTQTHLQVFRTSPGRSSTSMPNLVETGVRMWKCITNRHIYREG
jgi:hypothetical protein